MYVCARVCACKKADLYKMGLGGYAVILEDTRMLEKDIVIAIMKYLKTVPRCFAWKEHGGMYGTAGIPDIIACVDGRFYAFEVKTETGKPTKLQEATIRKILKAGGVAVIVRSVNEVQAVIEAPCDEH